jgi:hypothetical protein
MTSMKPCSATVVLLAWSMEKTWLLMQLDLSCLSVDARAKLVSNVRQNRL